VRILARIVSLPFAIFFIALGSFGLLASYGTGTELVDQSRRQLQLLNRWAIDQGVELSRDFSVTTEEWVTVTVLRFG
jgi:hypothetical protein